MSIRTQIEDSIARSVEQIVASVYIPEIVKYIGEHKNEEITEEDLVALLDLKITRPLVAPVTPGKAAPKRPTAAPRASKPAAAKTPLGTCLYRKTKGGQERCTTRRTGTEESGMCKTHEKSAGGKRQQDEMKAHYGVDSLKDIAEPLDNYEPASRKTKAGTASKKASGEGVNVSMNFKAKPKKSVGGFNSITIEGEDYVTKSNLLFRNLDGRVVAYGAIRNNKLTLDLTDEERATLESIKSDLSPELASAIQESDQFDDDGIDSLDNIDLEDFE